MISVSKETSVTVLANTFFSEVFAHFVLWTFDDWAGRCVGHWCSDHFLHGLCFNDFYLWRAVSWFEIRNVGSSWFHLIDGLLVVAPRSGMVLVMVMIMVVSTTLVVLILIVVLLRPRILLIWRPARIELILTVNRIKFRIWTRRPCCSWQNWIVDSLRFVRWLDRIVNSSCCGPLFKEGWLWHAIAAINVELLPRWIERLCGWFRGRRRLELSVVVV